MNVAQQLDLCWIRPSLTRGLNARSHWVQHRPAYVGKGSFHLIRRLPFIKLADDRLQSLSRSVWLLKYTSSSISSQGTQHPSKTLSYWYPAVDAAPRCVCQTVDSGEVCSRLAVPAHRISTSTRSAELQQPALWRRQCASTRNPQRWRRASWDAVRVLGGSIGSMRMHTQYGRRTNDNGDSVDRAP